VGLDRVLRILDLCGGTGAWSQPYREAGYDVEIVDPAHDGRDVRLLSRINASVGCSDAGWICAGVLWSEPMILWATERRTA
jgi:hypothetical protein